MVCGVSIIEPPVVGVSSSINVELAMVATTGFAATNRRLLRGVMMGGGNVALSGVEVPPVRWAMRPRSEVFLTPAGCGCFNKYESGKVAEENPKAEFVGIDGKTAVS